MAFTPEREVVRTTRQIAPIVPHDKPGVNRKIRDITSYQYGCAEQGQAGTFPGPKHQRGPADAGPRLRRPAVTTTATTTVASKSNAGRPRRRGGGLCAHQAGGDASANSSV